ncbi:MAG: DUF1761 domain-containing protein [Steroidobacteraceae bacterium]
MGDINIWAVLTAAAATFIIGGLWYSPLLFAKAWQREAGVTDERLRTGNQGLIFGLAFALSVIAAFVFAMFLGPKPAFGFATGAGFAAGLAWVAASIGIIYLFERRSCAMKQHMDVATRQRIA